MPSYDELLIKGFERACEKNPDRPAIIHIGEKFSYRGQLAINMLPKSESESYYVAKSEKENAAASPKANAP